MLTDRDIAELTAFRRVLHRQPEVSGEERKTAATIRAALEALQPTQIIGGLGGHGVAAVFDSGVPGETVMFRCELDGLPITETTQVDWRSEVPGKGHLCGHDGHMTIVLGLARVLSRRPVARGRVVLMFQPSEEDGRGARAVVADPRFADIAPDWAFAIHNLPGVPLGTVATDSGMINPASQGMRIRLTGKEAHAAAPETGVSPATAMCALIAQLPSIGPGGPFDSNFRLATVTHAQLGAPTFGIAPGDAVVHVTLRAATDAALRAMAVEVEALAHAKAGELALDIRVQDAFAASVNDAEAVAVALSALDRIEVSHTEEGVPMRASEDFGVFGWHAKAAMLCLGSGVDQPALHHPDFDFPDKLIPIGLSIFEQIARDLLD